ncbi:MAG: hypothetical protein FGM46_10265 [Ferruginibacter sp.]|nr:hypothetical protein [Ferruginibacter sp.]
MKKYKIILLLINMVLTAVTAGFSQTNLDSIKGRTLYSGSLGITNNGFSIIPSFSFNDPAAIVLLSWKKNRFSVDPEFRITPTLEKGSILLWFRYHAIEGKRFSFRVGAHPAVNWFPSTLIQNGVKEDLVRLRRFFAWELLPSYRISSTWNVSLYYLQGNGLQRSGPQTTHFINLNTTITNIRITHSLRLSVSPAFFYLFLDGDDGVFFTASASLGIMDRPFLLQSTINQKLQSSINGTLPFMWNVGIAYTFKKHLSNN